MDVHHVDENPTLVFCSRIPRAAGDDDGVSRLELAERSATASDMEATDLGGSVILSKSSPVE